MTREDARSNLLHIVLAVKDLMEPWLPDYFLKRRDKREPGRRAKEEAEDALLLFLMRHFRKQAKRVRARVEGEKAIPQVDDIFDEMDEEEIAELIRLLQRNTRGGIDLFATMTGLAIDYSMTNLQAAEWARRYAGELVKNIDATSLDLVQRAVQTVVETPGWTLGDLMDDLMKVPVSEERAQRIAETEVTRSYAQGQLMAGEEMRAQFPDVKVMKQWFTNNDEIVCTELCEPLDGVIVGIDENFYEPESDYEDGNPPRHPNCRCWISTSTALAELDYGRRRDQD